MGRFDFIAFIKCREKTIPNEFYDARLMARRQPRADISKTILFTILLITDRRNDGASRLRLLMTYGLISLRYSLPFTACRHFRPGHTPYRADGFQLSLIWPYFRLTGTSAQRAMRHHPDAATARLRHFYMIC